MPLRNQFASEAEWLEHLRLYFAAKAMQALINPHGEPLDRLTEVPEYAYEIADAMLAGRSQP